MMRNIVLSVALVTLAPLVRGDIEHGKAEMSVSSVRCKEKDCERILRSAVRFLRFLPQMIETCADDPSLAYYGTGESGHWAVQCSQQVMAALAILSEVSSEELSAAGCTMRPDELRALASERADEICMDCAFAPCHVPRGHVLYDVVYLVSACDGKAAARMAEGVSWDRTADALTFVGVDGIKRKVILR